MCLTGCLVDVAQTLQKFSKNDNHQSIVSSITNGEIYTSAILEPLHHDPENPTTSAVFDNDKIIIISGGFYELIYPVVSKFGIKKENIFANTFIYDKDGKIIGVDKNNPLSKNRSNCCKFNKY